MYQYACVCMFLYVCMYVSVWRSVRCKREDKEERREVVTRIAKSHFTIGLLTVLLHKHRSDVHLDLRLISSASTCLFISSQLSGKARAP